MNDVLETSLGEEAQKRVRPIVSWLLEERLNIGRTTFLFSRYCERLRELGLPLDAPLPALTLQDERGESVDLAALDGPLVLVFYRGFW